jgi:hypothetical protein
MAATRRAISRGKNALTVYETSNYAATKVGCIEDRSCSPKSIPVNGGVVILADTSRRNSPDAGAVLIGKKSLATTYSRKIACQWGWKRKNSPELW